MRTATALLIYFICFVSENVQEQLRDNICQELILWLWFDGQNSCVSCVVSLCETQCLYQVIFRNIFIEPIHAFIVKFLLSVSPVVFLAAVTLAHFSSDRSSAVNMYIIISYVSSNLHHMSMVFLFFKGKRQDVTVLVPLVHFF